MDQLHELLKVLDPKNVVDINFENYGLNGFLTGILCEMTRLQTLQLGNNSLGGFMPNMNKLTNLMILKIDYNQISGPISPSICQLPRLKYLILDHNRFKGSLPVHIGHLKQLKGLVLHNNELSGDIPASLSQLSDLKALNLSFNAFTGSISPFIGSLSSLKILHLENNGFTGSLPLSIGNLIHLERLDLSNNEFTGTLPLTLFRLTQLKELILSKNKFSGCIPSNIHQMEHLEKLCLDSNQFRGDLPAVNLKKLRGIGLSKNYFSEASIAQIGNIASLEWLVDPLEIYILNILDTTHTLLLLPQMKHVDNIMAIYQSYDDYMNNIPSYDVNSIAVYLEQEDMKKKEKVLYENDRLKDIVLCQICCDSNVSHRLISKVASDMSCCAHSFCETCCLQLLQTGRCPICRFEILGFTKDIVLCQLLSILNI